MTVRKPLLVAAGVLGVCSTTWTLMAQPTGGTIGSTVDSPKHVIVTTSNKEAAAQIVAKLNAMNLDESKVHVAVPGKTTGKVTAVQLQRLSSAARLTPGSTVAGDWVKIESIFHARQLDELQAVLSQINATYTVQHLAHSEVAGVAAGR